MLKNIFLLFTILFFTLSCQPKIYDQDTCNTLSFKSFKGSPKALNELNKNCKNINYKYTKEYCQKVLTRFILTGSRSTIMQEFGPRSVECLTEKDIEKFSVKKKEN